MKKVILSVLMTMICVFTIGQTKTKYDSNFKYSLFSNMEIGVAGVYSYQLSDAHLKNYGASLMLTKRIGDYWRLRGIAEVNGFKPNGFDRFGKEMFGVSFDLLPLYIFVDEGVVYNPSSHNRFGLALDGGAGLQFKLGDVSSIYIESSIDRVNTNNRWQSNVEVKAGYSANLGITEQDRIRKSIDNNMRSEYGELKGENKILKSELQKCQDATTSIQESAAQMAAMVESLQAQLNESKAQVKTVKENCSKSDFYPIVFDFGSAEITDAMDDYIMDYAEMMQSNSYDYKILGYCSANGTDWKNQILSEKRANVVYHRLILYGVDESRLHPEGKGMSDYDKASEQKVIIVKVE